jgi:type I restriction enzyme R subunit
VVDFVGASRNFADPEWDGEPIPEEPPQPKDKPFIPGEEVDGEEPPAPKPPKEKIIIKLAEGKELMIKSMSTYLFYFQGQPVTAEEFIKKLFNTIVLPTIFKNEDELRRMWSSPITRNELIKKLEDNGFSKPDLKQIQTLIEAEDSDIFDVLEHIAYSKKPIPRTVRVTNAENKIHKNLNDKQKEFIDFVLSRYVEGGVDELDLDRLSSLIELKYSTIHDGLEVLGNVDEIKRTFIEFQKHLY